MAKTVDIEKTSIPRLLWYYSMPSIVGALINALYNVVDRIFIGQGVGALAISGMTLTFPIMNILGAFGILVGQGTAAYTSILLGKKKHEKVRRILPNAIYMTLFLYILIALSMMLFLEPILKIFGGSEATIPYAKEYLQILIPGNILLNISFSFNNIIRAAGHPIRAMYTLLIGAAINVILDPIFIFWFGLGIRGAAIATLISMFISGCWVMNFFFKKENLLSFQQSDYQLDLSLCKKCLIIGLSPFLINICTSFVNILMNHTLFKYGGDLAIGAFGIITSYTTLIVMAIIGLSQGAQPIIGYNYGAGKYDRVRQTLKLSAIVATIITTIGSLFALLFPNTVAHCFTSDPELINITVNGITIYISIFFIVGFHIVATNYFQNIGYSTISIILSLSRQILILIPFILIYPPLFQLNGAWMAQPTSNIFSAVIAAIFLWHHLKKDLPKN